ncbi:MAG: M48 family metallopeptidase [Nitrospirae bacterium]|nr:M48 family metallopeptidase [Nitrospirota bacterium]MBI3351313.1 M48 family metallopeptidase [Nitrospirota bacterium]
MKLKIALSALLGTLVFAPIFYFVLLPVVILTAAKFVPVSWEEQYGRSIVEGFAAPEDYCKDRRLMTVLDSVLKDLSDSIPNNPYHFHLKIVNDKIVNAFALPGGIIIVFSGLLEETDSPDEFAGVLAHEIQHIVRHHSTREILRQASTSFLVSSLTGHFGNDSTFSLRGVRMLETLHYDRKLEEEADREGMKLLVSAKYQPEAMIRMFEKFEKGKSDRDPILTFLSTHPATENRIKNLKELMNQLTAQPVIHSQDSLWNEARLICQNSS